MPTTPSTQRAPSNDTDAAQAGRESGATRPAATASTSHASALDGLHDVEELSVETWLHLSLGMETG